MKNSKLQMVRGLTYQDDLRDPRQAGRGQTDLGRGQGFQTEQTTKSGMGQTEQTLPTLVETGFWLWVRLNKLKIGHAPNWVLARSNRPKQGMGQTDGDDQTPSSL